MAAQRPPRRRASLAALAEAFEGELLHETSPGFDERRRVWNGMIDRRPRLIALPQGAADVALAVRYARQHKLPLAIRGGAHNVAGLATCDGGLLIDLARLNAVSVDGAHKVVRVGGGARLGEMDRVTQAHALAVPAGVVSETGIAGLTLSGGVGWLRNRYGLTCDNLTAAEIVTAAGDHVRASKDEHAELLWALRGGGGNFGVVTAFEFSAHPVGPGVMTVAVFYEGSDAMTVLRAFREVAPQMPEDISPLAFVGAIPEGMEDFPRETWGQPTVAVLGMYAGPPEEGERAVQPLRQLGDVLVDLSAPRPYVEFQRFLDEDYPAGQRYYWKSANLDELNDDVLRMIADYASRQPSKASTIDLWYMAGAARREPPGGGAYNGRDAKYILAPEGNWTDEADDAANIGWVRGLMADARRFSTGEYLNFPGFLEEGERVVRTTFGSKYERLVAIKSRWDPDNFFRINHNIPPQAQRSAA